MKNIQFRLRIATGPPARYRKRTDPCWRYFFYAQHLLAGVSAGSSRAQAIVASANHFATEFARSSSSYLQERAPSKRRLLRVTPANLR
ncbi:hypothetical protein ACNKHK_25725 [Shigella flexneri]